MATFEIDMVHGGLYLVEYRAALGRQTGTPIKTLVSEGPNMYCPGYHAKCRILLQGQWIESDTRYQTSAVNLWPQGANKLWFPMPDDWYDVNLNNIVSCERERVTFKDGSELINEEALWLWAALEEQNKKICRWKITKKLEKEEFLFEKINDKNGRVLEAFIREYKPKEREYSGGSERKMGTPVYNNSPFTFLVCRGYNTTACGWAENIYVHPGHRLSMTSGGGPRTFSDWREVPVKREDVNSENTFILEWDETRKEIIQIG